MKNKNTPIIPELTRSGYQAFFENFDDSWEFEKDYPLSNEELTVVGLLRKRLGEEVSIIAIRRVEEPKGIKMPDLIVNGVKVDIKRVSSKSTVDSQTRSGIKQVKQGGGIIYDIRGWNSEGSPNEYIEFRTKNKNITIFGHSQDGKMEISDKMKEVAVRSPIGGLRRATSNDFIVSKNGEKVKISSTNPDELGIKIKEGKKKNTAASYAGHDSVFDGRTSAFSVIDESVSNLILPQNIKKVNELNKKNKLASTNVDELGIKTKGGKNSEIKENSLTELYPKQDQTASSFIISQKHEKINKMSTHYEVKGKEMKIKELPEKYYEEIYGKTASELKLSNRTKLNREEFESFRQFSENIDFENLFIIKEVQYPQGIKSADLFIDGAPVEIKSFTSEGSLRKRISDAKKQIKGNGWLILDETKSKMSEDEYFRLAKVRATNKNINNFAIVKNGEIQALHFLDKEKKPTYRKPRSETLVSDIRLFYDSILSQKREKVNVEYQKSQKIPANLARKPQSYWQKRSLQRTVAAERQALPYIRKLREEYARSSNRSIDNVRRIYENYFSKAGFDRQKLREIVPSGELSKYLKEVRKLGIELPDNYKYRVSREEFAQAQLWLEAKKLGVFENQISTELYSKIINQSFTQTFGDYGVNFTKLNTEALSQILNSKFHGENFSTRIWGRTDRLADELQAKLAFAVAKGQSWEKTSREIRERFGVSQSSAERLIRTETNYFENSAEIEAYDELGVKEFEFLAALDGRTSEICRHHHGKRFKVKDAKAGVNTPPLHPNCRSTVVAVVPELENTANIDIEKQKEPVEENSIGVNIKKPPVKQASESEVKNLTLSDSLSGALKTDDVRQKVINKINSMPKTHKAIWAKFNSELKFIDAPNGGDSFSSLGSIVKVRAAGIIDGLTELTNHTRKPFEILLHEYGHGFDHRANRGSYKSISAELKLSNNKTLGETILSEANSRLKSQEGKSLFYRRQSLMKEIKSEIENGYSKNDLLSIFDLYGGAAFKDGMKVFGVGHEPTYWSGKKSLMGVKLSKEHIEAHRAKALGSEGFAEMFSATARKDKKEIELYEKYLPESFAMFNELLERISKL